MPFFRWAAVSEQDNKQGLVDCEDDEQGKGHLNVHHQQSHWKTSTRSMPDGKLELDKPWSRIPCVSPRLSSVLNVFNAEMG